MTGTATVQMARFPGTADRVREARRFVAGVLGESNPCRDDAVLLTSELATNALRHTASGEIDDCGDVGTFTVTVEHSPVWVRICVRDEGSSKIPCVCKVRLDARHGRGVGIVDRLARRWGFVRENGGTAVWFEFGDDGLSALCG